MADVLTCGHEADRVVDIGVRDHGLCYRNAGGQSTADTDADENGVAVDVGLCGVGVDSD